MAETPENAKTDLDPFDPASFRVKTNFAEGVPTKRLITSIPVERPHKQDFIRTHPEHQLDVALLELKRDREIFIVRPECQEALSNECFTATLFLYVNTLMTPRFWPVRLPGRDGKHNPYHASALEIAQRAIHEWTRVQANQDLGAYEATIALAKLPEPTWPEQSMGELLRLAFRDRIIDALDHPVLLKLRGESA
jgi:hypothetical protein